MALSGGVNIEWAVASSIQRDESESGDLSVVLCSERGALVAAVDGLGHGHEAAVSALAAIAEIEASRSEPLERVVARCHARLKSERGVVMSLASLDFTRQEMAWLGVGNVTGRLVRDRQGGSYAGHSLLLRQGVVGGHLPPLQVETVSLQYGDTLVLATDGIDSAFADRYFPGSPRQIADAILTEFGLGNDDALVLVARYLGGRR